MIINNSNSLTNNKMSNFILNIVDDISGDVYNISLDGDYSEMKEDTAKDTSTQKMYLKQKNLKSMRSARNASLKNGHSKFLTIVSSFNENSGRIYHTVAINPVFAPKSISDFDLIKQDNSSYINYILDKNFQMFLDVYNCDDCPEYIRKIVDDGYDGVCRKGNSILSYFHKNCKVQPDGSIELSDAIKTTYDIAKDFKDIHIVKRDYRQIA